MEVNNYYDFGELKSGDRFVWNGVEHEKLSGNLADVIGTNQTVEVPPDARVYLYETW